MRFGIAGKPIITIYEGPFTTKETVMGIPVHEIPKEDVRKGDLLYFTGHIAMYIGEGRFIHATGKVGSDSVALNSFNPGEEEYRQDLREHFYAAGSIFSP